VHAYRSGTACCNPGSAAPTSQPLEHRASRLAGMEYVNSFSQLQQRSSSVSHVSLCAAMDLVAAASEDSLTIYRTVTWYVCSSFGSPPCFCATLTALPHSPLTSRPPSPLPTTTPPRPTIPP
jgi:hypothetical protein